LLVFAAIGSRIARDNQRNVLDLRASIDQLSAANLELTDTAKALRASESQAGKQAAELQAIMDAAPAIILTAHDSKCLRVSGNRTAYVLMRQKPGSNLSMAATEHERPTNRRVMKEGIEIPPDEMPLHRAALTGQPVRDYELHIVFEDGGYIDLFGNVEPVLDEDGRPHRSVAVLSDITSRKQAEAVFRVREQQLASIYHTVRDVIFYLAVEPDGQFRFVSVNAAFLKVTGLNREMVIGKTVNEVIPEPSLTMVLGKYREAIEENTVVVWEETSDYPTGRLTGEVSVSPLFDDKNTCTHLVGSVHDITERQKAEAALRESEERLRNAQRLAHVGTWEWDVKTNRVFCSGEIHQVFAIPLPSTPDYSEFFQAVEPQDRERLGETIRNALSVEKGPRFLEFQITRPDGDVRTVAWTCEVYRDDGGSPVRMSGALQDITDQKRAEATLRRSLDEIAHLNRVAAMGELTASMAHELNQPLAAILSNAQAATRFLDAKPPDLEQIRECLTDIVAADKRAGEVIKRLRKLLKKDEFQASMVDLNEVVGDVIRLIRNDALLRGVSVVFEPSSGLPSVFGDRIQLYQVVLNLTVNGLEATGEQPSGARWLIVRTAVGPDGGVLLTVRDSGKGIAEADLARVFEPFFTTKQEGLGMGLSISRSIVQAHGGRIWAENALEDGAIFSCVWPVAQQAMVAATKP
jgi:PAS domain S-box-containing protein